MMRACCLAALCAVLPGCAATPPPAPRTCPPLPVLAPGAGLLERRQHLEAIVRMYTQCAGVSA
jgi:hypothetical protein